MRHLQQQPLVLPLVVPQLDMLLVHQRKNQAHHCMFTVLKKPRAMHISSQSVAQSRPGVTVTRYQHRLRAPSV
jgi:hypothetical protein